MDFLTHLCLPIAIVFILRNDLAQKTPAVALAGFALLPDFDKFLGIQGLLHSLVTLLPLCFALVVIERRIRHRVVLSPVIVFLIGSHLVLDFIDGGPVPLLYPLIETGIGLQYPARLAFGEGVLGVAIQGPLVALETPVPRSGYQSFGFINGTGVMSLLVFVIVYGYVRGWLLTSPLDEN